MDSRALCANDFDDTVAVMSRYCLIGRSGLRVSHLDLGTMPVGPRPAIGEEPADCARPVLNGAAE